MSRRLRVALVLTAGVVLCCAGAALADNVKFGPVKGAVYSGLLGGRTITLKVAPNGATATAKLAELPLYCSSGGGGGEVGKPKPGAISKHSGSLITTITFTSAQTHKAIGVATIKGSFFTFAGSAPVFEGDETTTLPKSFPADCAGAASFEAIKR